MLDVFYPRRPSLPNVCAAEPVRYVATVRCPSENTLIEFGRGNLAGEARVEIERHLDTCPHCRALVAEAARVSGGVRLVYTEPSQGEHGAPQVPVADRLGRYIILDELGAGGMGVVYSAYDPELDRKVAVKLLRPGVFAAGALSQVKARLLREAQTMARLSHPNVVAIHDVGGDGDQVFIAMEYVRGLTLKRWLAERPRTWREVLEVVKAAGRGLAAAHAAGIVHRDFKPDNVLISEDANGTQVKVTDFGLARLAADVVEGSAATSRGAVGPTTVTGMVLGTPAYMAPEQYAGQPLDARTDQFSFSVALFEALHGERPFAGDTLEALAAEITKGRIRAVPVRGAVPSWLQRVVSKGLRAEPEERHASMDELLTALASDPGAARRRLLTRLGAVGLAVALGVVLTYAVSEHRRVCRGAAQDLSGIWDDAAQAQIEKTIAASGTPFVESTWRGVKKALDAFAGAYVSTHTEACEATHLRGDQSNELLDLRMLCLKERLGAARAVVELLKSADKQIADKAIEITDSLPSLKECSEVKALTAKVPQPQDAGSRARIAEVRQEIDTALALRYTAKRADGLKRAEAALSEARSLSYPPLTAHALLVLGGLQSASGSVEAPVIERTLNDAAWTAIAGRDFRTAARAFASLIYNLGVAQERFAEVPNLEHAALGVLEAYGRDDEVRATIYGQAAAALQSRGDHEGALAKFQQAVALLQANGGPEDRLAVTYTNMSLVLIDLGRTQDTITTTERALTLLVQHFGPNNLLVAVTREHQAGALGRAGEYARARQAFDEAQDVMRKIGFADTWYMASVLVTEAGIFNEQGEFDAALANLERARPIVEKTGALDRSTAYFWMHMADALLGKHNAKGALAMNQRALGIGERTFADSPDLAYPLVGMGRAYLELGKSAEARPLLERALKIREKGVSDVQDLAEARFVLAAATWGNDRSRALKLAEQARDALTQDGKGSTRRLAEVEAWLATHAR